MNFFKNNSFFSYFNIEQSCYKLSPFPIYDENGISHKVCITVFIRTNIRACADSNWSIVDLYFLTGSKFLVCFAFKKHKNYRKQSGKHSSVCRIDHECLSKTYQLPKQFLWKLDFLCESFCSLNKKQDYFENFWVWNF